MAAPATNAIRKSTRNREENVPFSEAIAWQGVGEGWRQLNGSFRELGYSIEWHDFATEKDFDWSRSFHPDSVEICLNLAGRGDVQTGRESLALAPLTAGFYAQNNSRLTASRRGGERHQFITVELSLPFLENHITAGDQGLHPRLDKLFSQRAKGMATVSEAVRLTNEHQLMVMSLQRPPVFAAAQRLWYQAKALEVAAALLYQPLPNEELFCQRQKRLSDDRVQKVIAILKNDLAEPPPLEEIGRRVGCSHFYLSRIFTQTTGKTISAQLRELRMERAAELLREGRMNVTQVALEVGYSSPSHFSTAFHEIFGCCPGLYPLATVSQQAAGKKQRG
jgi:AraC-like DNA-binding protein